MFENYEGEYLSSTRTVAQDIERIRTLIPGAERDSLCKSAQMGMESATEIVQQMELEAQMASGDLKRQLAAQAKDYKAGVKGLRAQLDDARRSAHAQQLARAELLSGTDKALVMESDTQRDRLLATTTRLQKGSAQIQAACATALETEQIGASILGDLDQQRQTIEHARGTLSFANVGLARSKKLLSGMTKRALANKVMMMAIIAMLVFLILFVLFGGLLGGGGGGGDDESHSPPPPSRFPPPPPHAKHGGRG
jgi:vesicle transport through interaction with t-SNAREs protein 1